MDFKVWLVREDTGEITEVIDNMSTEEQLRLLANDLAPRLVDRSDLEYASLYMDVKCEIQAERYIDDMFRELVYKKWEEMDNGKEQE